MGLWDDLGCVIAPPSRLQRAVRAASARAPANRALRRVHPLLDRVLTGLSGGRTSFTEPLTGLPTITLVTVGARTGLRRHTSLIAIPSGGDIAVIGSNYGSERTPSWVRNLRATPEVEVEHAGRTVAATARELSCAAAEAVWATATRAYAGYGQYRNRAGRRVVTVWLLSPRGV